MDISFLKSNRFQALVVLAVVMYLGSIEILSTPIVEAFMLILGGHIGIKTVDRISEKLGKK